MKHQSYTSISRQSRALRLNRQSDTREIQLVFDFERTSAPDTPPVAASHDDSLSRFASRFAAALEADPSARFDNAAIGQLAREVFGNSAGHARDIYDSAEAGFNIYLSRIALDLAHPVAAMDRLLAEDSRLPLQTRRDNNQVELQQFSTPHAEGICSLFRALSRWRSMPSGLTTCSRPRKPITRS